MNWDLGVKRAAKWLRQYRIGFDGWGLALFSGIMVPNFIWFAVPAPEDILRAESVTGGLDAAAGVCQVLLAAALIFVVNRETPERKSAWPLAACACYYTAWGAYYLGFTGPVVILALSIFPCAALLAFETERKNYAAMAPTAIFTACHVISSLMNFVL